MEVLYCHYCHLTGVAIKPSTFVLTDKKVKCLKYLPEQEMLQTFDDGNPGRSHQYLSDIWEKFFIWFLLIITPCCYLAAVKNWRCKYSPLTPDSIGPAWFNMKGGNKSVFYSERILNCILTTDQFTTSYLEFYGHILRKFQAHCLWAQQQAWSDANH